MKRLVTSFILLISIINAYAYTECRDLKITHILNDGNTTFIGFNKEGSRQLNGYFDDTNSQYNQLLSIALAARSQSVTTVRIRYTEDNLSCDPLPLWNTKIQAIGY